MRQLAAILFLLSLSPLLAGAGEVQPPAPTRAELLAVVPGGLTADQVARRAMDTSPDLEARLREADAALVEFFPRLTLVAGYAHLSYFQPTQVGPGLEINGLRNYTDLTAILTYKVTDVLLQVNIALASEVNSLAPDVIVRAPAGP